MVSFFGWYCEEPVAGLRDPYEFLPNQDSLYFCDSSENCLLIQLLACTKERTLEVANLPGFVSCMCA